MEKIYAIAHGDILSFRLSTEAHFKCRSIDSTETSILNSLSVKKNYKSAVEYLASLYSCDRSEVLERIEELSIEMYGDSQVLSNTLVYFWEKESIAPVHIIAEVTSQCNMSCRYCYGSFGANDLPDLKAKEWNSFFSALLDNDMQTQAVQLLNITGGEPTMRKDLFEILEWSDKKFGVSLFINCMRVEKELIDVLVKHSTLLRINTSFDSIEKSIDESMRGKGFHRRLENLTRIDSLDIPITINIGIWRRPLQDIEKTIGFFCKLKNTSVMLSRINQEGRAQQLGPDCFLNEQEYKDFSKQIRSDLKHLKGRFRFEDKEEATSQQIEGSEDTYRCSCGLGVVAINSQGILKPCVNPLGFFEKIGAIGDTSKLLLDTCAQATASLINSVGMDIQIKHLQNGCVLPYIMSRDKQ